MVRFFSENQYLKLKRAPELACEMAGGVTLAQRVTRVNGSMLTRYAADDKEHKKLFMPIDVAVDVDRAAKDPVIVSEMAALLGYRLEPLATRLEGIQPLSEEDAYRIMDEATELWCMTRAAFADGKIDALERKQLRLKLHELIAASHCILEKLEV